MSLQVKIYKKFKGFTLNTEFETSGECLGILGASGCGKSMTLKCIAGIERPDYGRIILNGRVLFDSDKKIFLTPQQRNIGYLFQDYALFPNMTVEKNIGIGVRGSKKEKNLKVCEMIKLFHLDGLEGYYPAQLSGGQQQRVALARILAYEPAVLMLDEPFSALDSYLKELLQLNLKQMLKYYKGDVLLVTHSRDEVYRFCGNVVVMDSGCVVNKGQIKTLFREPGNVTTAKLSGCKNISKAEKVSDHMVKAVDWGITFKTSGLVTDDTRYLGIRAHDFKPVYKAGEDEDNIFCCNIVDIVEGPFELNIMFAIGSDIDVSAENTIWWKVSMQEWKTNMNEKVPQYLKVAPEDIMLLKG